MRTSSISLPSALSQRIETDTSWSGVGNDHLLHEPLLGLIASRKCPGRALLEILDLVPQWVEQGRVILSGFQSPMEQQVLRSTLRRTQGRVIKLLARGLSEYRVPAGERNALNEGRMLVMTACPPNVRETTRATALARNRLVLALATDVVVPHVSSGSPLAEMLRDPNIAAKVIRNPGARGGEVRESA